MASIAKAFHSCVSKNGSSKFGQIRMCVFVRDVLSSLNNFIPSKSKLNSTSFSKSFIIGCDVLIKLGMKRL